MDVALSCLLGLGDKEVIQMTYSEILDKFKNTYPFMKVTNYRPVCHELFEVGKMGITIWLDNGDMVVYYPNQERGDSDD